MMYVISYKLRKPGHDYKNLYAAIEKLFGTHWHHTTSTWLVQSSLSAKQIYENLSVHIDGNDEMIILRLANDWHGRADEITWLKTRTF